MQTVKAAIAHEFNAPLRIEEVQLRAPQAGEVEVSIHACAICMSDISFLDGGWGGDLPAIYGHEAAGIVSGIGDGVSQYAIGDRVLVTLIRACGTCSACASGAPVACHGDDPSQPPFTMPDGAPLAQMMDCGAFAEKTIVHPSQLAPIPKDMPFDVASLLSCGVITGVGAAVNTAGIRPGQTVVVIGAGGVGLNAIQGARIAGAAKIIAVDLVAEKLDAALEFGATHGITADGGAPWEQVAKLTNGAMAQCCLVTVGATSAYDTAPRYIGTGGKVVMVGMPHSGATSQYEPVILAALGQSMIGSKMGDVVLSRDIPWLIDLYQQGRLKLDELISHRWPLADINAAIADTKSGAARRNVILFDHDEDMS